MNATRVSRRQAEAEGRTADVVDVDYRAFLRALGVRIKELRKQRGWSQRDMVVMHGINDSQWRKYERGGGITLESVLKVAALFKISITELLDGLGEFSAKDVPEGKPTAKTRGSVLKSKPAKHLQPQKRPAYPAKQAN